MSPAPNACRCCRTVRAGFTCIGVHEPERYATRSKLLPNAQHLRHGLVRYRAIAGDKIENRCFSVGRRERGHRLAVQPGAIVLSGLSESTESANQQNRQNGKHPHSSDSRLRTKRLYSAAPCILEVSFSNEGFYMPLYEYECTACHRRTEKIQKFSDPELTVCPHCAGRWSVLSPPHPSSSQGEAGTRTATARLNRQQLRANREQPQAPRAPPLPRQETRAQQQLLPPLPARLRQAALLPPRHPARLNLSHVGKAHDGSLSFPLSKRYDLRYDSAHEGVTFHPQTR